MIGNRGLKGFGSESLRPICQLPKTRPGVNFEITNAWLYCDRDVFRLMLEEMIEVSIFSRIKLPVDSSLGRFVNEDHARSVALLLALVIRVQTTDSHLILQVFQTSSICSPLQ